MKLNPLNDYVIARRLKGEEVSPGGIMRVEPERPDLAEVLAVGPGKRLPSGERYPLTVKAGDTVALGKYTGTVVKVDGESVLVMKEDDIFGVVAA